MHAMNLMSQLISKHDYVWLVGGGGLCVLRDGDNYF